MGKEPLKSLGQLGVLVSGKRGKLGLRATAAEIGVSPATLSRVERGYLPDLANFTKICRWLALDPSEILGLNDSSGVRPVVAVHFRKERTMKAETAEALANMILAAQRAMMMREDMG